MDRKYNVLCQVVQFSVSNMFLCRDSVCSDLDCMARNGLMPPDTSRAAGVYPAGGSGT